MFTIVEIEGKLLRQRAKGAKCKLEISVDKAKLDDTASKPVQARLILEQACLPSVRVGARVAGVVHTSRLRSKTRKTKNGTSVLEFSAKIHGVLRLGAGARPLPTLVGTTTRRANGRLIGDAAVSSP